MKIFNGRCLLIFPGWGGGGGGGGGGEEKKNKNTFASLFPRLPALTFHLSPIPPVREKSQKMKEASTRTELYSYHCSNVSANMFAEIERHFFFQ